MGRWNRNINQQLPVVVKPFLISDFSRRPHSENRLILNNVLKASREVRTSVELCSEVTGVGAYLPGEKRAVACIAEFKNAWSCTSIPSICLHDVVKNYTRSFTRT